MPIPTTTGFNTALTGLEAMQAGIDTTSENISNSSNPDYVNESVDFGETGDYIYEDGSQSQSAVAIGTGVTVESIQRDDDPFLDQQYYTANAAASNSSTVYNQLSDLESDLDVSSSSGLSGALSSFFSSWDSLSTDSGSDSGTATAQNVISTGETLASTLNSLSTEVSTLQTQAQQQLTSLTDPTTGQVEQYASQIAQLNTQIAQATAAGQTPNDLEDERATAIDNLSALVNVTVTPVASGTNAGADTITLGDGTKLVDGTVSDPSDAVTQPATYTAADGGEIGALAALADTNASDSDAPLAQIGSQLDSLASSIASTVNTASGTSFFVVNPDDTTDTSITAANISVSSSATTASVEAITPTTAGDVYGQYDSVTDSYSDFITQIGDTVDQADDTNSTNQSLLTSVTNQVQSVSGVSLDQEMTNLISFQQGYEASAKVMSTMQSVIETLIDTVGGGV